MYKDLQNLEDFEMIQNDIDKFCQWTIKWLMFFNLDKCKILHIGKDNPNFDYQMEDKNGNSSNSTNLIVINCGKDLGVYVQDNLKFDKHISLTVNRADLLVLSSLLSPTWMKKLYYSACTSGRFRHFYARNLLPYAENSNVGRTLTSPLNLVGPSAISVT